MQRRLLPNHTLQITYPDGTIRYLQMSSGDYPNRQTVSNYDYPEWSHVMVCKICGRGFTRKGFTRKTCSVQCARAHLNPDNPYYKKAIALVNAYCRRYWRKRRREEPALREKEKERTRLWRLNNPDKAKAYKKWYNTVHREKRNENARRHYHKHKEEINYKKRCKRLYKK